MTQRIRMTDWRRTPSKRNAPSVNQPGSGAAESRVLPTQNYRPDRQLAGYISMPSILVVICMFRVAAAFCVRLSYTSTVRILTAVVSNPSMICAVSFTRCPHPSRGKRDNSMDTAVSTRVQEDLLRTRIHRYKTAAGEAPCRGFSGSLCPFRVDHTTRRRSLFDHANLRSFVPANPIPSKPRRMVPGRGTRYS